MIGEEFLGLLRCPLTLSTLAVADESLLASLHARIAAGTLLNRAGQAIDRAIDSGLVDEGETVLYPVHDEIPCLLIEEAIPLEQLGK